MSINHPWRRPRQTPVKYYATHCSLAGCHDVPLYRVGFYAFCKAHRAYAEQEAKSLNRPREMKAAYLEEELLRRDREARHRAQHLKTFNLRKRPKR